MVNSIMLKTMKTMRMINYGGRMIIMMKKMMKMKYKQHEK